MLPWGAILLWLCSAKIFHVLFSFYRFVQKAKATGLPYTYSLINEYELIAFLTDPILRWVLKSHLMKGNGWPKWARFMVRDWMYEDKGRAHTEYGDVFLVVSPGGMICYVGNARVAMQVSQKPKSFIKPPEKMKITEIFGPHVGSTNGDIWRFHVRVSVPSFGDAVNRLVWDETIRQTNMLASAWAERGSRSLKLDIYTLAVNVLCCAAFGQPADWTEDAAAAAPAGHKLSLAQAIDGVIVNLPYICLIPKLVLKYGPWNNVYRVYTEYDNYLEELLAKGKQQMMSGEEGDESAKNNLLTTLLKQNESKSTEELSAKGPGGRSSFTDGEVKGNAFAFMSAGYDTIANTILFSSLMLTLYPHIQDTIIAENNRVHAEAQAAGRTTLCFDEDLPKLRYLFAFMFEILRMFPIVIPISRTTPPTTTEVLDGATLPPGTGVVVNNTGVHFNTAHWPLPETIDPRRWLCSDPNAFDPINPSDQHLKEVEAGDNTIPNHERGSFMGFNEGTRPCLGKRFAQTEFIGFFSRLLREYRLNLGDELDSAAVEKSLRFRTGGSPITLTPPEDVRVYLTPHAKEDRSN